MLLLLDSFENYLKEINKKMFHARRIGDARLIWKFSDIGLFHIDNDIPQKWTKFSFIDLVYLKMLIKLHQYGSSMQDMIALKEYIAVNYGNRKDKSGLQHLIAKVINRETIDITISLENPPETRVNIMSGVNYLMSLYSLGSYLYISLNKIIKDFILNIDDKNDKHFANIKQFGLLSEPEIGLLAHIISGEAKNITITHNNKELPFKSKDIGDFLDIVLRQQYSMIKYSVKGAETNFKLPEIYQPIKTEKPKKGTK